MNSVQTIEFLPIKKDLKGELSDEIYYECDFCGKKEYLGSQSKQLSERICGNNFYCSFCLRNNFNTKNNKNVLILSFRAIFGCYYYNFHLYPLNPDKMIYLSEIQDYVDSHIQTGLENPAFHYDPSSCLWFIDFNKTGKGKKEIRLDDVLKTISNILVCFNFDHYMPSLKMHILYDKFKESIEKFYKSRYRPDGRPQCIPTLAGCQDYITTSKNFTIEDTKYFTQDYLNH